MRYSNPRAFLLNQLRKKTSVKKSIDLAIKYGFSPTETWKQLKILGTYPHFKFHSKIKNYLSKNKTPELVHNDFRKNFLKKLHILNPLEVIHSMARSGHSRSYIRSQLEHLGDTDPHIKEKINHIWHILKQPKQKENQVFLYWDPVETNISKERFTSKEKILDKKIIEINKYPKKIAKQFERHYLFFGINSMIFFIFLIYLIFNTTSHELFELNIYVFLLLSFIFITSTTSTYAYYTSIKKLEKQAIKTAISKKNK